jgi:putative ABC transport system substrate-binding protein
LSVLRAGTTQEIDAAFATLVQQPAGALLIGSDPFFNARRDQFVALAARYNVPAIFDVRDRLA